MRSKEEIQEDVARLLYAIRTKNGLSKTKISEILEIDKHTWIRWEAGASSPTLADLVTICERLGIGSVRPFLDILMPSEDEGIKELRKDIAEYYVESATTREARIWEFSMNESADKNTQLESYCAIGHLPQQYRFFLLQQLYVYYQMAKQHRELTHTDEVMPDMDVFAAGLKKTQKAAFDKINK